MTSPPTYPKPKLLAPLAARHHAVIEASAGTGKTFTIEHLVADLILRGVDVGALLVVTFTERAAGELRARIRALLWRLAAVRQSAPSKPDDDLWTLDAPAHDRLHRALAQLDAAHITTIHAFCQRLLTENAFAHRRLFSQRLIDGRALFGEIFREVLREHLRPGARLEALLRPALEKVSGDEDGAVQRLEALLYEVVRCPSPLRPALDEAAVRAACEGLARALPGAIASSKKSEALAALLEIATRASALTGVPFWSALAAVHDPSPTNKAKTVLTQLGDKGVQKVLSAEALSAVEVLAHGVPTAKALLAITCAPELRERMARAKADQGLYDFDDMLGVLAATLDAGDPALVAALRARYSHVLIDEFQDTDPLQWRVFSTLFFSGVSPSHLYVIGDPKQAIYGFRAADVQTYLAARDALGGGLAPLALTENFRSSARMIAAYNHVVGDVPHFFGAESGIAYGPAQRVTCGDPSIRLVDAHGREAVPVHLLRATGVRSTARDSLVPPVARRAAQEIGRLLQGHRLVDRDHPEGRPLEPRDVFVLCGTQQDARIAMDALSAARIPFAPYKLDGLFETSEVADLHALLSAIAAPHEPQLRMRAWLTPFYELWPEQAEALRHAPADAPPLAQLLAWNARARRDLRGLLSALLDDTGLARRAVLVPALQPAVANLRKVLGLLLAHARQTQAPLDELCALLARWRRGDALPDAPDAALQASIADGSAVQVMTLHASKGLEAAVVFVLGGLGVRAGRALATYRDASRTRLCWVGGREPASVKARIAAYDDEERRRLAYVALTRAKGLLYAPVYETDAGEAASITGAYGPLHQRLHALTQEPFDPALFAVEPLSLEPEPTPAPIPARRGAVPALVLPSDPGVPRAALAQSRLGGKVTSYTAITRQQEALEEHLKEAHTGETNRAPTAEGELPTSNVVGTFLHDALERLDLPHVAGLVALRAFAADARVRALVEPLADAAGVAARHRPHAYALLHAALHTRLPGGDSALPPVASLSKVIRETEFSFPIPERAHPLLGQSATPDAGYAIRRGLLHGFMDLIVQHRGKLYVGDWKSSVLRDAAPDAIDAYVRTHFEWQIAVYGYAALRMLSIHTEAEYQARFGGMHYLFLREMARTPPGEVARGVWFWRPSWSDALAWEQKLLSHGYGHGEVA